MSEAEAAGLRWARFCTDGTDAPVECPLRAIPRTGAEIAAKLARFIGKAQLRELERANVTAEVYQLAREEFVTRAASELLEEKGLGRFLGVVPPDLESRTDEVAIPGSLER